MVGMVLGCTPEPSEPDLLDGFGILGSWELSSRTRNGVVDLLPQGGELLELTTDSSAKDLNGAWTYEAGTTTNEGTFALDSTDFDVFFYSNNSTFARQFQKINADAIYFYYTEGSDAVTETWFRR